MDEGFELVSVLIALTVAVLMVHGFVPHVVVGSAVTCTLIVIAPSFRSEIDSGASVPTLQVTALPLAEHWIAVVEQDSFLLTIPHETLVPDPLTNVVLAGS